MKRSITLILTLAVTSSVMAWERTSEPGHLGFGNKYHHQINDRESFGLAYTDKPYVPTDQKKFCQRWGLGYDIRIDDDTRIGFRLGYDDSGRSQPGAIGFVIGRRF